MEDNSAWDTAFTWALSLALCAAVTGLLVAFFIILVHETGGSSNDWAAWVQGVGSVLAVAGLAISTRFQVKRQHDNAVRLEKLRSLTSARDKFDVAVVFIMRANDYSKGISKVTHANAEWPAEGLGLADLRSLDEVLRAVDLNRSHPRIAFEIAGIRARLAGLLGTIEHQRAERIDRADTWPFVQENARVLRKKCKAAMRSLKELNKEYSSPEHETLFDQHLNATETRRARKAEKRAAAPADHTAPLVNALLREDVRP